MRGVCSMFAVVIQSRLQHLAPDDVRIAHNWWSISNEGMHVMFHSQALLRSCRACAVEIQGTICSDSNNWLRQQLNGALPPVIPRWR